MSDLFKGYFKTVLIGLVKSIVPFFKIIITFFYSDMLSISLKSMNCITRYYMRIKAKNMIMMQITNVGRNNY
jgi:hypothetical protein